MASFSGVTFVFVLLRFRLYAFVEAAAFCLSVLRYAGVPIAALVSFSFLFFPFVYLEMSLFRVFFCSISSFSLYGEDVVPGTTFFPSELCFSTL